MTEFEKMMEYRKLNRQKRVDAQGVKLTDLDLIVMAVAHQQIEDDVVNLVDLQKRFMRSFK